VPSSVRPRRLGMAKSKAGAKSASDKDKSAKGTDDGKLKAACSVKVRHILCEKRGRLDQAIAKLAEGVSFEKVAGEYSEDKARQGGSLGWKTRGCVAASLLPALRKRTLVHVSTIAPVLPGLWWAHSKKSLSI
jgi:hypothetical protein